MKFRLTRRTLEPLHLRRRYPLQHLPQPGDVSDRHLPPTAARRRRAARTRRTVGRGCPPPRAGSPPRTRSGTEARAPVRGCSHVLPWAWPEALRGVGVAQPRVRALCMHPAHAEGEHKVVGVHHCLRPHQRLPPRDGMLRSPHAWRIGDGWLGGLLGSFAPRNSWAIFRISVYRLEVPLGRASFDGPTARNGVHMLDLVVCLRLLRSIYRFTGKGKLCFHFQELV
ncbi:hypothetical protein SORBI_3001G095566 [Sorghum bicolor]|uniref:Uncharacterized protein n=1 Tax=Sorghum bicolor TaxID=4558 RepID=A0A1Z5S530_SORBI|nr:hypothetical protein SORBI_3001G095566 [Sorghum bicolor]